MWQGDGVTRWERCEVNEVATWKGNEVATWESGVARR